MPPADAHPAGPSLTSLPVPPEPRGTVLISSMSARGKGMVEGPSAVRALHAAGWKGDIRVTTSDEDPKDVAASAKGPYVVAIGGDGYLARVVEGMEGTGNVLVPFPGGRGNDLCRALGADVSMEARTKRIARFAKEGVAPEGIAPFQVRPLDAIEVTRAGSRRLAVGVVSVDIVAWANVYGNRSWIKFGPLAYAHGAIQALAHFHGDDFGAIIDGERETLSGWVVTVSNTAMIGGGVKMTDLSDPGDGQLELITVGQMPLRKVLPILIDVLVRRKADVPELHVRRVNEITLTSPDGNIAMADGDEIGRIPLRMATAPRVVDVLV